MLCTETAHVWEWGSEATGAGIPIGARCLCGRMIQVMTPCDRCGHPWERAMPIGVPGSSDVESA